MLKIILQILVISSILFSQNISIPKFYSIDKKFNDELKKIVVELDLNKDFNVGEDGIEQISLAVIDLTKERPVFGGVNPENFIYPASVYKMYVAAEILNQVYQGKFKLSDQYTVKDPNAVDRSKISDDYRPLLKDGDTVSINYLLDLMITRSDNTSANCLIDIAKRENINEMMKKNNWLGSEVTRKFLKRKFEDSAYVKIRGTETCALHAADFMYKIYKNQLISPFVSMQMQALLGRQLDKTKLATGLPSDCMFYHKTGWFSYWTNDVGIVNNGKVKYIIACFLPIEEEQALPKMKQLSERIYKLISK